MGIAWLTAESDSGSQAVPHFVSWRRVAAARIASLWFIPLISLLSGEFAGGLQAPPHLPAVCEPGWMMAERKPIAYAGC